MNKMRHYRKRGSAIALAMVVVMILLAMGTGLLSLGCTAALSLYERPRISQPAPPPTPD